MRFEPGITCVVGPNGSGKSNVVDAFTWVMGEQGAKSMRGGKMDDVVFAGTAGRPALGRAEVTLTIDNSDGSLPIDYAEVTISRLLFRSGQSEYAINGDHCRLLDVQELLSDTGLGREMHVIVGQGQLDEVLNAGPEARRALIEEAAGVLKHRKRKEKALRKLDAMQANLTRLVDLTGELGRRLKPLGRQAQIARKAAVIQADLRDARLRLLADDYVTLAGELQRDETDEAAAAARRAELDAALARSRVLESELEGAEQQHAPRLAAAQETYFALGGLSERLRGAASLAQERYRHLAAPPEPQRPGRDPDELDHEAAGLREQEAALGERLEDAREQLTGAVARRTRAETALAETERQLAAGARAAAQRAEQLARLRSQVQGAQRRSAAAAGGGRPPGRGTAQARGRAEQAQRDHAELQQLVSGRGRGPGRPRGRPRPGRRRPGRATPRVAAAATAEHAGQRPARCAARAGRGTDRSGQATAPTPRVSCWRAGGVPRHPGPAGGAADGRGRGADAIAAALGATADAVAVSGLDAAVGILAALRREDTGRAELVIADGEPAAGGRAARGTTRGWMPGPGRRRPFRGLLIWSRHPVSWPVPSSACWPGSWSSRTCGRA